MGNMQAREQSAVSPGTQPGERVPAGGSGGTRLGRIWMRLYSSETRRARITLIGLGLICASLLGVIALVTPKAMKFDSFFLLGCALIGWAIGSRAAVLVVVSSAALLFYHDAFLQPRPGVDWIFYWNSLVRLLACGAIAWLAGSAGAKARNLEQSVTDRTTRWQTESRQHQETAELLTEAIQLFRQVTDNITDVFWVTDPTKSEVEFVSPGFERVWGRACSELYSSPGLWMQGIHPDDRQRVARAAFSQQAKGDYDEEYRVVRPDGALRWVHDRAFPVKDEKGAIYRIVGIAEDITERKRSEQLLQAERDLGAALSSTSELKFAVERVLDIAMQLEGIQCGGLYLMNPQTGELHLEAHRGLSSAFVERIAHYKAEATEARLARTGRITYVRHEQIPRNLQSLWGSQGFRALAVVPLQHNGVVLGMLNLASFGEDEIPARLRVGIELIASQVAAALARIRAEENLRRSEAHLRTIINSAPIALLAFDACGVVTFEEGQALGAMGIKPAEHLGSSLDELYGGFPLMQANLKRALAGDKFSSVVPFGDNVLECRFKPLQYPNAASKGFVWVATDISERFRLERQILEISDREQARLGQDIHDGLCQQLVGVALVANSLEQALSSPERAATPHAGRLCALLDEAITESRRVARGLYPVRLEREGLGPALTELAAIAAERFQIECVSEATPIEADTITATHLYRIAQEGITNAGKHSGARKIMIRLNRAREGIDLEIEDDGKGIARPLGTGHTGMGLYIMEYRARSVGGTLRIESGPNGTQVCCHVPQADNEPKRATD